jgi:uncharacterized protein YaaN involved in tellurite resistance
MSNENQGQMVATALKNIQSQTIDKTLKLNVLRETATATPVIHETAVSQTDEDMARVNQVVDALMGIDFNDSQTKDGVVQGLRIVNEEVMDRASNFTSEALEKRMGSLKGTEEGDMVYETMITLNDKIKEIHPKNHNLVESWIHKILPFLSPVRNYFAQFQTMQSVIDGYKKTLEEGIQDRELDLEILRKDKSRLYEAESILKDAIAFNKLLESKLQEKINMEITDAEQKQFLEGQILHNLLRQTQGLEEMRAVNLQGQMSIEMLLKTGLEVIDGAKRCIRVSVNALTIAGVIQQVLTGQRKLLEAVQEVNATATDMVDWNAQQLNTTMLDVSKMAMETSLDIDVLTNAIQSSVDAIDADIKYRQESVPMIRDNINRLSDATKAAKDTTHKLAKERHSIENYSETAAAIFA